MPNTSPLRLHPPRRLGCRDVDCIGLPQIPEEARWYIQHGLDNDMPPHVEAACDAAIAAAMAEHQRRRGMKTDDP